MIFLGLGSTAQVARFLEKGQSGFGLRIGAEKTYGVFGFSGQISGSIKGIVDIELSLTKDIYDKNRLGLLDDKASSLLPELWINWWIIRKQIIPVIDVNFAIWGEYAYAGYKNYRELDPDTTDYKYYMEGQLGFELSVNFRVTDTWWVQPGFFAYYAIGQEQWDEKTGKVKNNYQGAGSSINVAIVKRIKKSSLYFMANQYFDSYQGSTNKYKLSVGYIFGF